MDDDELQFGGLFSHNKELSKQFKNDPRIENYIQLRRKYPNEEIEVATSGGLEWLFANEGLLKNNDIEPQLVASSLDANEEAISELCLLLLQKLLERKNLEKLGETHISSRGKGISDAIVNYLITMMLDALSWTGALHIPRDLIVLTRYQLLGTEDPAMEKQLRVHMLRSNIVSVAAQFLERNDPVSVRALAKAFGVNASTVSRMFPEKELRAEAKKHLDALKQITKSKTPYADIATKRNSNTDRSE